MCCTRLAENTGRKKSPKIRHLRTVSQLCRAVFSQLRQWVSRLGDFTASTSLNRGQPNFARCVAISWAGTLYIHFRGLLPRNGIFSGVAYRQYMCFVFDIHVYFKLFLRVFTHVNVSGRSVLLFNKLMMMRCKIHFAPKSCVVLYWQRYCTALE